MKQGWVERIRGVCLPLEKSTTHNSTTLKDPAESVYTRPRGSCWLVDSLSILSSSVFTRNRDILLHVCVCVFFFFFDTFPFCSQVGRFASPAFWAWADQMERGISDGVQSLRLFCACVHIQTVTENRWKRHFLIGWFLNKSSVLTFLLLSFSQWWFLIFFFFGSLYGC